jgi:hypothetical protein
MNNENSVAEVPAVKDGSKECPVPTAWRPIFVEVVNALVKQDYELQSCPSWVAAATPDVASQIRAYIQSYGATLVELPQDSWKSSVCIWSGSHWDVLVDLWTKEEGASDLVLGARVAEAEPGFSFQVQSVYVP